MLSQYDQSVYDAGYKYIPQSKYLLNPFQVPAGSENEVPTGIATTYQAQNMGGGGGGGFNPYNPDMNQIRTDFDPTAYNLAMRNEEKFGPTVGPNPDMYFTPQSQFQKALGTAINFIPGIGTIKKGAEFLKGMMPINERAIMENEARGAGILTDDIGRIVAGPGSINTGQNIMAGYNLNKVTRQTINDRRAMIEKNMKDPAQKEAKLKALDDFEKSMFGSISDEEFIGPYDITGGVIGKKNIITKYRKDKKAAEAAAKKAEEDARLQAEIEAYNKAQAQKAQRARDTAAGAFSSQVQQDSGGGGSWREQTAAKERQGVSVAGPGFGKGAYFMDGGLVDLVDIYD